MNRNQDVPHGRLTSYAGLFADSEATSSVTSIRIPLVQRDYAQGRTGAQVEEIRDNFVDALHAAVTGEHTLGLDFVYGDLQDGTLLPLDGQQRLTTLFLLHWLLCVRSGNEPRREAWSRFQYDTRPSARRFCERLVGHPPEAEQTEIKNWILDQPWFLHGWQHDPTIISMLTMLDSLERRFVKDEVAQAWQRLTHPEEPAITFLLLPIAEIGAGDELYIKMNSRGKPLTAFENFKARFERSLSWTPDRAKELAHKIDGDWSNLLWPLRGDDDIVDDEFMRYIQFLIEVCEWRHEHEAGDTRLHDRASAVFGEANPHAAENLTWLVEAFDCWADYDDVTNTFDSFFSASHHPAEDGRPQSVVLFGADVRVNLFAECCRSYGMMRGKTRVFSLGQSLMLYATLQHKIRSVDSFPSRLRVIRNLLAASEDQVRRENMPKLLRDVDGLLRSDTLEEGLAQLSGFAKALAVAELEKLRVTQAQPQLVSAISRLEDDNLLRGQLGVFELDSQLPSRSDTFAVMFNDASNWRLVTAALLTKGDYQRPRPNSEAWQFGTSSPKNDGVWRNLFAGQRDELASTRSAMSRLLDGFVNANVDPAEYLDSVVQAWLSERQARRIFDWRYYLVRYDVMRSGETGIYFGDLRGQGYSLCMLRRTQLNSLYRDPQLLAVWLESGVGDGVIDPWFTGYPDNPRYLQLRRSGVRVQCVEVGFELTAPADSSYVERWDDITAKLENCTPGASGRLLLTVASDSPDSLPRLDAEDRVVVGATALRALVAAGL